MKSLRELIQKVKEDWFREANVLTRPPKQNLIFSELQSDIQACLISLGPKNGEILLEAFMSRNLLIWTPP